MSVTPEDASEALRMVHDAGDRSRILRGYQSAAPHLMLWGVSYAIGYTATFFEPNHVNLIWLAIVPVTCLGDALINRQDRPRAEFKAFPILCAAFLAFIVATAFIMQPSNPNQMGAFVPLVVACVYVCLGVFAGYRLLWTGVALGVATLTGFFALPTLFPLWMAGVGGSALFASGLWLRRV